MHFDEAPGAGFARSQRVVVDAFLPVGFKHCDYLGVFAIGQCVVHQAANGAGQQLAAGPDDVAGD